MIEALFVMGLVATILLPLAGSFVATITLPRPVSYTVMVTMGLIGLLLHVGLAVYSRDILPWSGVGGFLIYLVGTVLTAVGYGVVHDFDKAHGISAEAYAERRKPKVIDLKRPPSLD